MKRLVFDLDETICSTNKSDYKNALPNLSLISKLRAYKKDGFAIVIYTSRNMRTYNCNIGKINANTLPQIVEWLDSNKIPYDEIYIGKPWCGNDGFYIDDKAVRPEEFIELNYKQICSLVGIKK